MPPPSYDEGARGGDKQGGGIGINEIYPFEPIPPSNKYIYIYLYVLYFIYKTISLFHAALRAARNTGGELLENSVVLPPMKTAPLFCVWHFFYKKKIRRPGVKKIEQAMVTS